MYGSGGGYVLLPPGLKNKNGTQGNLVNPYAYYQDLGCNLILSVVKFIKIFYFLLGIEQISKASVAVSNIFG